MAQPGGNQRKGKLQQKKKLKSDDWVEKKTHLQLEFNKTLAGNNKGRRRSRFLQQNFKIVQISAKKIAKINLSANLWRMQWYEKLPKCSYWYPDKLAKHKFSIILSKPQPCYSRIQDVISIVILRNLPEKQPVHECWSLPWWLLEISLQRLQNKLHWWEEQHWKLPGEERHAMLSTSEGVQPSKHWVFYECSQRCSLEGTLACFQECSLESSQDCSLQCSPEKHREWFGATLMALWP